MRVAKWRWWLGGGAVVGLQGALACQSALDCGLNGDCRQGRCYCDSPWYGEQCDVLRFRPTRLTQGYAMQPSLTTWGGSIFFDGQKYHMFVVVMTNACSLAAWRRNSRVDHAVADTAEGPYVFKDTAINTWTHNPMLVQLKDGTFAIFHIGDGSGIADGGKVCDGRWASTTALLEKVFVIPTYKSNWNEEAENQFFDWSDRHGVNPAEWDIQALDKHDRAVEGPDTIEADQFPLNIVVTKRVRHGSSIHTAKSLDGPWEPLMQNTLGMCNNPAPSVHSNGTIYILCRKTLKRAEHISGPWRDVSTVTFSGGVPGIYEDPFLYIDRRGFHLIYHVYDKSQREDCRSSTVSAHLFSPDGYEWYASATQPFGGKVAVEALGTMTLATRERPSFLFDKLGRMTHLITGVCSVPDCASEAPCANCKYAYWDYTLVQALEVSVGPGGLMHQDYAGQERCSGAGADCAAAAHWQAERALK
eukprot:TRINITY_DN81706_c0_g1_i1.p1 TRINITY_DN81706_c0_g1~~TRINITY_DN81706_c0_g1_i1.p1  ORF type:complete len:473 (-),score=95.39 TRINITY_DN81706_c0_g1_i1:434-1852(-)